MLQLGTRLGDYEILDILQTSRKEVIYKVRNLVAQRLEAMKVLPDNLQRDQESLERFFREIKLHARLLHPNIVTFYHAGPIDGITILTTELVEGVTLEEKLELGPIPLTQAVSYARQLLAALAHAHSHNILHREVTPENIIVLADGGIKLGGFGLAKSQGDISLTQVGTTLGPVHYMSPEQVKGRGDMDHRSDLYAAGVVVYEMVTGRKPFNAASDFEVMLAHVQKEAPPPASINRSLPTSLDLVLAKAMAKKPEDRYQSADEFSAALEEIIRSARAKEVQPSRPQAPLAEPMKPATIPPSLAAAARVSQRNDRIFTALLVLTLLVVIFWSLSIILK